MLKVQVICDHRANIVYFSGPHIGCTHDDRIFYEHHPTISRDETILADKAYVGRRASEMGIITPFKSRRGRELTEEQKNFNLFHAFYRSRVEHSIGYLKRFAVLSQRYRGRVKGVAVPLIAKFIKVLIHLNYIQTYKYPLRRL